MFSKMAALVASWLPKVEEPEFAYRSKERDAFMKQAFYMVEKDRAGELSDLLSLHPSLARAAVAKEELHGNVGMFKTGRDSCRFPGKTLEECAAALGSPDCLAALVSLRERAELSKLAPPDSAPGKGPLRM